MASIKLISNKPDTNLSLVNSKFLLAADKPAQFQVPEWATGLELMGPPQKITLLLKDKANKTILKTVTGTTANPIGIVIEKKYAGSYTFNLEAILDSSGEKASTVVAAYSAPKIVTANWSKQKEAADQSEINYGNTLYINLDTEGLNGDNLTLELYNKKDDKKIIDSIIQTCTNGDATFEVNTLKCFGSTREIQEVEDFFVQVKSPAGEYIAPGGDPKVINFSIKNKLVAALAEKPENKTPLKIGKPAKAPLPTGAISLEKIAVTTTYDVCNDEVDTFDDFKNFWVLENKGKYYHWLKTSLIGLKEVDDKTKPTPLPITLSSGDKFIFEVTFKAIIPIRAGKIRVKDKDSKYEFEKEKQHSALAKDAEVILKFSSKNSPYSNTVQYFPNFELIFEHTVDDTTWIPVGSAQFYFYITWKQPLWPNFQATGNERGTMKVECKKSGKPNILETLLWLSCSQSKGLGKTEEELMNAFFKRFETKKVERCREGQTRGTDASGKSISFLTQNWKSIGLGYWRQESSITGAGIGVGRSDAGSNALRYLLGYGEARCGEWDVFLQHIALCHGIIMRSFIILTGYDLGGRKASGTGALSSNLFLVGGTAGWTIRDPKAPKEKPPVGYKAQGNPAPLHFFADHVFSVLQTSSGYKFYDPSYGIKSSSYFADSVSLLNNYSSAGLDGVVYLRTFTGSAVDQPEHHFKFDLHFMQDLYGRPFNFETMRTRMADHLAYTNL
jgi:hypothetical protein